MIRKEDYDFYSYVPVARAAYIVDIFIFRLLHIRYSERPCIYQPYSIRVFPEHFGPAVNSSSCCISHAIASQPGGAQRIFGFLAILSQSGRANLGRGIDPVLRADGRPSPVTE